MRCVHALQRGKHASLAVYIVYSYTLTVSRIWAPPQCTKTLLYIHAWYLMKVSVCASDGGSGAGRGVGSN